MGPEEDQLRQEAYQIRRDGDCNPQTVADLLDEAARRLEEKEAEIVWFRDATSVLGLDTPGGDGCNPLKERLEKVLRPVKDSAQDFVEWRHRRKP